MVICRSISVKRTLHRQLLRCSSPPKPAPTMIPAAVSVRRLHPANCIALHPLALATRASDSDPVDRARGSNLVKAKAFRLVQTHDNKAFVIAPAELTSSPYAEASHAAKRAKQWRNASDHCPWKGLEEPFLTTPSVVD